MTTLFRLKVASLLLPQGRQPVLSRATSCRPRQVFYNSTTLSSSEVLFTVSPFKSRSRRLYSTTPAPSSASSATESVAAASKKLSKFRQYAEQFKSKPASHLIAFGILHEITAVVPLPIVYFALVETGVKIPFPEQAMEEGNKFVQRIAKYYGWDLEGSEGARMMLNVATSYAVVKTLMPLRLALCAWMTPWTAMRMVSPVMNIWKRFRK